MVQSYREAGTPGLTEAPRELFRSFPESPGFFELCSGSLDTVAVGEPGGPDGGRLRSLFWKSSLQTIHSASRTIWPDIFECPWNRSVKTIGTSTTLSPCRQSLCVISIWKLYPFERISSRLIASSARLRKHLYPPVGSVKGIPVIIWTYFAADLLSISRLNGQLITRMPFR